MITQYQPIVNSFAVKLPSGTQILLLSKSFVVLENHAVYPSLHYSCHPGSLGSLKHCSAQYTTSYPTLYALSMLKSTQTPAGRRYASYIRKQPRPIYFLRFVFQFCYNGYWENSSKQLRKKGSILASLKSLDSGRRIRTKCPRWSPAVVTSGRSNGWLQLIPRI